MKRKLGVVRIYQSFGVYSMSVFERYQVALDSAKANLDAMADELICGGVLQPEQKDDFLSCITTEVIDFVSEY
jgi:hypothetical protein